MKIEKSKYEGYIWYSDQQNPRVLCAEDFELDVSNESNPFIIEGHLYDGKKSISIKYADGKYIVKQYLLEELSGEIEELSFVSHRMNGRILEFKQYWREENDVLCSGMPVLQAKELVFVGFKD